MKRTRANLLIFCLAFPTMLLTPKLIGGGILTPERAAADNLARAFKYHASSHGGQLPATWNEIGQYIDLDQINRSLIDSPSYPIQQHYVFASGRFQTTDQEEGEILMICSAPLVKSQEEVSGRYMIWKNSRGIALNTWIPEGEVQDLLKQPGVKLLPPQPMISAPTLPSSVPPPATHPQPDNVKRQAGSEATSESSSVDQSKGPQAQPAETAPQLERDDSPSASGKWLFILVLVIGALAAGWAILRRTPPS